jgi:diguanylate cyclase (GGDEF)-like protein
MAPLFGHYPCAYFFVSHARRWRDTRTTHTMTFVPRTFRSRIALLFGVLSWFVGLPTYWFVSNSHREQMVEDQRAVLQGIAESAATVIAENLTERRREIELLAQSDAFRQKAQGAPSIEKALERLKQSYPHYSWIGLTDAQGTVRSATSQLLKGQSAVERPWFQQGRRGVFVGDVHEAKLLATLLPAPSSDQPLRFIDFASPVLDENGQLRGVLAAHAHWHWAGTVLKAATPRDAHDNGIDIFIVNAKDAVIQAEQGLAAERVPSLQATRNAKWNGHFLDWGDATRYLTTTATVNEPTTTSALDWRVVVRQPEVAVLQGVAHLQRGVLLLTGAAGVAFVGLAWLTAWVISRPIERLTEVARRIQVGDERIHFEVHTGSLELRRLSTALGAMAATLLERKKALETSNQQLEVRVAERTEALRLLNQDLEKLARTDALTGLPNRMATNETLVAEFARFKRSQLSYAVLMIDIDFFKRVNDKHGHPVGDAVLQHVARIVRQSIRESDFAGRLGGEEFLVILPMTAVPSAVQVAEKIRTELERTPPPQAGTITISVGVGPVFPTDLSSDDAVQRADQQLYRAKANGRNRVASDTPNTPMG